MDVKTEMTVMINFFVLNAKIDAIIAAQNPEQKEIYRERFIENFQRIKPHLEQLNQTEQQIDELRAKHLG